MFQLYKMDSKVVVIIDADSSCSVALHGAKVGGTLNGKPVSSGGTYEYLKQVGVDGLPGESSLLVTGPSEITDAFTYVPALNSKGTFHLQCTGTRDSANDAAGVFQAQVVKGQSVTFDLKSQTTPISVSIIQKLA